MNKPLVSIIIVNWNGLDYLKVCLPSLFGQNYKNIEVIIVDNASKDGSIDYVKKNFPKTAIIANSKNLGFAQANNIGYKKSKGEYVLLLNNDTKVTPDFLKNLINVLNDKEIGIVQPKILLLDKPTYLDSVGAFLTPTGFLYHYGVNKPDQPKYSKRIYTYSAKGACILIRREVLEKTEIEGNIFDPDYFAYFEETDLCHRVWLSGFKIAYEPKSVIYHKMGATSSKLDNSFVQYHSFKNRINSYLKNLGPLELLKILPVHLAVCEIAAVALLIQGKFSVCIAIQKAILWNFANLKITIKKRQIVQTMIRAKKDYQILPFIKKSVSFNYYLNLFTGLKGFEDKEIISI